MNHKEKLKMQEVTENLINLEMNRTILTASFFYNHSDIERCKQF
jgi:hypothetical protein